jgi:hypothetical protein
MKVGIVEFATSETYLNKHLFDYEKEQLLKYESMFDKAEFYNWIKPSKRENRFIHDIWMEYQEYLNGVGEYEIGN